MSESLDHGAEPAEPIRLRLSGDEIDAVLAAAARRGMGLEEFVAEATRAFAAPESTRAVEAEAMAPHLIVPALERLSPPVRLGARMLGTTLRWAWTAAGRGRYRLGPGLISNGRLRLAGPGRISIGRDLNAWARAGSNILTTFRPEATIKVGDRVRLNGAGIQAATLVEIGDDVILGACTILDTDHHPVNPGDRRGGHIGTRPVRIGNGVWIGGAVVLKGVSVGDNSVIGLGSVVTADVPSGVVVAGNPARVVRRLDS